MKIDDQLIDKLSDLAKLEFEGEEREKIKSDLERMLDFVETLKNVDTEGVEPLIYMTDEYSELREDLSLNSLTKQEALKNAPSANSDYFKVPKVLKKGE